MNSIGKKEGFGDIIVNPETSTVYTTQTVHHGLDSLYTELKNDLKVNQKDDRVINANLFIVFNFFNLFQNV